ncbi:MAG TPA: hypothetical protein VNH18_20480 [Bryobacteraceae bacterium]|nr:hypothetical protein [Bryobacteraceae bacterium]
MLFVLAGFTQDAGFRVFAFDGIGADRSRTAFTVRVDLDLIRRHGIRVQELPLLCRALLEQQDESASGRTLTYTDEAMRLYAEYAASQRLAAQRKKAGHKPPAHAGASAWRVPQPNAEGFVPEPVDRQS